MSLRQPPHPVRLILKLVAFLGLSAVLTTVMISSVLDLNTQSTRPFHALFSDASGLQPGDNVRIAGVMAGTVTGVTLQGNKDVKVSFSLDGGDDIYPNTYAEIRYADLIGQRYLALMPANQAGGPTLREKAPGTGSGATVSRGSGGAGSSAPGGAPDAARPLSAGSTIPITQTRPALDLTAVFNGFQPLFNALSSRQINELSASIIQVFQGQSGAISDLVRQTATITGNLADRQRLITEVLTNLGGLLGKVAHQGKSLGSLIDNFNSVVNNLAGHRSSLSSTISGLATLTTHVSNLTQQALPSIDQDITGLSAAARTLSTNGAALNGVVHHLPGLLSTFNKISSSGSYLNVYICNLDLNIKGRLNVSEVKGLPAPQYPANVQLPSGRIGNPHEHTRVCS